MPGDWLTEAIDARRPFQLGELQVSFDGDTAIVEIPSESSETIDVPAEPAAVREWSRTEEYGRYRPLPGAIGMRRGWRVRCGVEELSAMLDAIYPLAPRHIARYAEGRLRVQDMDAVLGRQSGRYQPVRTMDRRRREVAQEVLCGVCVKTPVWAETPAAEAIPCPEPCSVLVALCRDLAVLPDLPDPVEPDREVQFAAFEEPGNEIRERCLERLQREPSRP